MRKSKFSDAQIVAIVRESEAEGLTVEQVARKYGITDTTLFRWRKRFGGPEASQAAELRQLQAQSERLPSMLMMLGILKVGSEIRVSTWKGLIMRWFNHAGTAASILSFAGASVSWWLKQPLLLGLAVGLGVGVLLGRWLAAAEEGRRELAQGFGSGASSDPRKSLIEGARRLAVSLTNERWPDFPTWEWTIPGSKRALHVVMERVAERVTAGMSPAQVEALVHEGVRMHINEVLIRRAAEEQANAFRKSRRYVNWVTSWRR